MFLVFYSRSIDLDDSHPSSVLQLRGKNEQPKSGIVHELLGDSVHLNGDYMAGLLLGVSLAVLQNTRNTS